MSLILKTIFGVIYGLQPGGSDDSVFASSSARAFLPEEVYQVTVPSLSATRTATEALGSLQ